MPDLLQETRLAGLLLAGGGLAMVVMVGPTAFIPPAIWNGPPDVSLRLIAQHRRIWRLANVGFALTAVLTAAGLLLVPGQVGAAGSALATAAVGAFLLASVPWLLILAIRLTITPGVAERLTANGSIDPAYDPIDRLAGAFFPPFILVAGASIAVLGAAIVAGGTLSVVLGWACVAAGLALAGGYLLFGDMLPALVYFPTTAVGIALLLAAR